jgi:hypothetical protein
MTTDFHISILYTFQGKPGRSRDGFAPGAGLIQATDGKLYGARGQRKILDIAFSTAPCDLQPCFHNPNRAIIVEADTVRRIRLRTT